MTYTLLNTVGSQNKNFSTMNYMITAPQKPAVKVSQSLDSNTTENDKKLNNDKTKKLLLGLGGLAVIGTTSVLIYNKMKKGKGVKNSSLESPLNKIKKTAKTEYQKLKEDILADFNENISDDLKVREGVTFNSSKDLEDFKDALKTGDDFSIEKYEKMRDDSYSAVKNKLIELQGDNEWLELRKQRKALLKNADAQDDQGTIEREKISIINDLMALKVDNSREHVFKNRNMMDVNDAYSIVRRDFGTLEEFNTEKAKVTKYDFGYDMGEGFFAGYKKLKVNDLFEEEQETYDFAQDNLNKIKNIFDEVIPKAKEDLHKKLSELAKNFRTSEVMQNVYNFTRKTA